MGGAQVCQRRNRGSAEDGEEPSQPAWRVEDFLQLCAEGQEHVFRGKARLLSPSDAATPVSAVQKLNSGSLSCPEGFCVVQSITRGFFGLLWRQGMKSIALEKLGVDERSLRHASRAIASQEAQKGRQVPLRPKRELLPDRREFRITVDRSKGAPLGIDVQPEDEGHCLLIEAVAPEGVVGQWNAQNLSQQVGAGDRIVEANGKRGNTEALITQCKLEQTLELSILPAEAAPRVRESRPQLQDGSCNTAPPMGDICIPIGAALVSGDIFSASGSGSASASASSTGAATDRSVPAHSEENEEFEVMVDRTNGSLLGVEVLPRDDGATLLIELVGEGLVHNWNCEHPDLQVHPGDLIREVNGIRGDLRRMIDQCKLHHELRMKIERSFCVEVVDDICDSN